MAEILVAEDEPAVQQVLKTALESEGHVVRVVGDGLDAVEVFRLNRPDLVILDLMMPKKNGFEVCTEIRRADSTVTVFILSARAEESDKVLGLGVGADDYIVKPFSVGELRARVNAGLRRTRALEEEDKKRFAFGTGMVDVKGFAFIDSRNRSVRLSPREVMMLRMFAEHPGEVLSRDCLLNRLWGVDYYGNTRTVDQHLARLRQKLGRDADRIETVTRIGYMYHRADSAAR